jgi:hypothetical protein
MFTHTYTTLYYMTFDFFYMSWSFVVTSVDQLNMNKTNNYFSNKTQGCCIAQKQYYDGKQHEYDTTARNKLLM